MTIRTIGKWCPEVLKKKKDFPLNNIIMLVVFDKAIVFLFLVISNGENVITMMSSLVVFPARFSHLDLFRRFIFLFFSERINEYNMPLWFIFKRENLRLKSSGSKYRRAMREKAFA